MSSLQAAKMMKDQVTEMLKSQINKRSSGQNVKRAKCKVGKMSSWQNVPAPLKLTRGPVNDLEVEQGRLFGVETMPESADATKVGDPIDHHLSDR